MKKKILLLALLFATISTVSWSMMMEGDMTAIDGDTDPADKQYVDAEENEARERYEDVDSAKKPKTLRERVRSWWAKKGGSGKTSDIVQNNGGATSSFGTGADAESVSTAETVMKNSLDRGNKLDTLLQEREGYRSSFWGDSDDNSTRAMHRRRIARTNFQTTHLSLRNEANDIVNDTGVNDEVRERAQRLLNGMNGDGTEGSAYVENDEEGNAPSSNPEKYFRLTGLDANGRIGILEGLSYDSSHLNYRDREQAQRMLAQERAIRTRAKNERVQREEQKLKEEQQKEEEAQREKERVQQEYEEYQAENKRVAREVAEENRKRQQQKDAVQRARDEQQAGLRGGPKALTEAERARRSGGNSPADQERRRTKAREKSLIRSQFSSEEIARRRVDDNRSTSREDYRNRPRSPYEGGQWYGRR